ncbi:CDF family Co(II)/Ni(II) efflux transporter DmeF [Roseibium marinum]|uniref:Cation diffusion facilitator family transporter n=1 Tax=Roseibium marinum TaxID=281252 RepID=A0A2S3UT72_9HYPH|nr:CDF family Co(II)/Ni(II) efflux transporter DmeF [Roseibium marinum]POF30928.1 cation diffusion facilitator family transporter [Roseibium marinum]
MSTATLDTPHEHVFLGASHQRNERKTWLVIAITTAMMLVEIVAGTLYGSMAVVADGWHMATHAGAMFIAVFAYVYARRNARNPRFTFGTGKFGDLAGFASAVMLGLIALLIAYESFQRFFEPVTIHFGQASMVAIAGLVVNLVCAWLLRDDHAHHHGHDHGHAHGHGHDHAHDHGQARKDHAHGERDLNLRAAYLHVLADALTSVLAIVALVLGGMFGWVWLDPAMGVVGGVMIARWSFGLIREAGGVLLDYIPARETLGEEIRQTMQAGGDTVTDIHVWRLGPGHFGVIVAIDTDAPKAPQHYRDALVHIPRISHLTVEATSRAA